MVARGIVVVLSAFLAASGIARAAEEAVFSPQTAAVFVKTAQEIFYTDSAEADRAMLFLSAAAAMDRNARLIHEQVLRIGGQSCSGSDAHAQAMLSAVSGYVNRQADLDIALGAIRCVLTHLNTRQDREVLLDRLLRRYATTNSVFGSELATQAGLLAAEKADNARALELLNYAYQLNPYNRLAFEKLQYLYAVNELAVTPEALAVHLRTALEADPYALSTILRYGDLLRRLELYPLAGRVYEYADSVFRFLYPDQTPDQRIYLPWLLSVYRTERQHAKVLDLAEQFRDAVAFDLMLESVAGRAAARLGRPDQARTILEQAADTAEAMLGESDLALPIYPEHLAWFYSFILERPDNALAWSNQAYSQAADRHGVRAIFGYTLAVNEQYALARQYVEADADIDQVAAITLALVRRHLDDSRQGAIDLLREAIAMSPDTFEAEKARSLLADLGADAIMPPVSQAVEQALAETFTTRQVPIFVLPRQRFSTKLLFSGSDFFYGGEMSPRLVIENNSSAPLVIQDGAMLEGYVRVDAALRGDLTADIPNVLSTRIRPGRAIQPNEHIFIPLDVQIGRLRRLLATYPQATVDVELTVYLDPVVSGDGGIRNALRSTSPIRATLQRRGVTLTRDFLMQRLDALARGQEGQKIQAAQLFAGLLAEQEAMRRRQADYAYTRIEEQLLVDAVRRGLNDDNWRLRVHTMDAVSNLVLPADFALIQTLSRNLNHDRWPVRFMAMNLLSDLQENSAFIPVLNWAAEHDGYVLNRRLAVTLGGTAPSDD